MTARARHPLFWVVVVSTAVSAGFTGYFGWSFGSVLGAIGLPTISAMVPMLWSLVAVLQVNRRNVAAGVIGVFALFFMIADALTNVGAVFAMRQSEIVGTQNNNLNAANARDQVERIKKRMEEIRARTTWQTDYLSPDAYDHRITALQNETERGRNIYQRSKECSNTTLPSSQKVCQAIASAHADKANALRRLELKSEMDQLQQELNAAKVQVSETPTVISTTLTQVRKLTSLATLNLDPSDNLQEAGYLVITGLLGLVLAIAPSVGSWALFISPGVDIRPTAPTNAPVSENPFLENHTVNDNRPVPAHYSNSETTFIIDGGGTVTGDSIARMRALRDRVQRKLNAMEAA